jgi:predicted nucleotidyltransferase
MGLREALQAKRAEILRIAAKHGAYNVRVFGSVARNEDTEKSDVDFLIDMEQDRSLLDMGGLLADLEDLLGRKVEIAEANFLHWYIRDKVLGEAVAI